MPGSPNLGRPNLVRNHCQRFGVSFDLALPPEVAASLSIGSLIMDDPDGMPITVYGKSYQTGGNRYTVSGFFQLREDGHGHFRFQFLSEDYGRPPGDIQPVDQLFELAAKSAPATPVEVDFRGTFEYHFADGWISMPPLPGEAGMEDAADPIFNSINSIGFCNIEDTGEIHEELEIRVTDAGLFIQEMHLRRDKVIDGRLVRSLFTEGSRLSSKFIARVEDLDVSSEE